MGMGNKCSLDDTVPETLQQVLQLGKFRLSLNLAETKRLFPSSGLYAFPERAQVVERGDPAKGLYIVLSGKVAITKSLGPAAVQVATFGPGEIFGEVTLMLDGIRSANAIAMEDCRIFRIAQSDIETLLNRKPELGEHLENLASRRLPV